MEKTKGKFQKGRRMSRKISKKIWFAATLVVAVSLIAPWSNVVAYNYATVKMTSYARKVYHSRGLAGLQSLCDSFEVKVVDDFLWYDLSCEVITNGKDVYVSTSVTNDPGEGHVRTWHYTSDPTRIGTLP